VLVDGPPAADPAALADALVDPLRLRGRPVLRVDARWFLRPASVRLERGRTDPDAYYEDRLDLAALRREVLDPLGPGRDGRWLPTLWDPEADRATRAPYEQAPPNAVLVLSGSLLLGRGLPAELTVHVRLSPAALARRTEEDWTLPAYDRYRAEVDPEAVADVVVRADDPRHPAVVRRTRASR
jgi:hypothetical protein